MRVGQTIRTCVPLVIVFAMVAIVILVAVLVLGGCYGWCCDRLAESLSRVNGGDEYVIVVDGIVFEGDAVRLAGREAHGAVEYVADAERGTRLDAKDEAGARGSVDYLGPHRAHWRTKHVYLVFRPGSELPKEEAENGGNESGENLHGGDYSKNRTK